MCQRKEMQLLATVCKKILELPYMVNQPFNPFSPIIHAPSWKWVFIQGAEYTVCVPVFVLRAHRATDRALTESPGFRTNRRPSSWSPARCDSLRWAIIVISHCTAHPCDFFFFVLLNGEKYISSLEKNVMKIITLLYSILYDRIKKSYICIIVSVPYFGTAIPHMSM